MNNANNESKNTFDDEIDEVRAALNAEKGKWPEIARDIDVSYSWLTKFAQYGMPDDPGFKRIAKLADRLSLKICIGNINN